MTGTNDKLRGLFLAMLMVVSVFAGTVALSGTAAAANEEPDVIKAVEDKGYDTEDDELTISFDDTVRVASNDEALSDGTGTDVELIEVYLTKAGTNDTTNLTLSQSDIDNPDGTPATPNDRYTVDMTTVGIPDVSPADDVKIEFLGEIEPDNAGTPDDFAVTPDNFTVATTTKKFNEGGVTHNTVQTADRVYQGEQILFEANQSGVDSNILLQNWETKETVLDGGTDISSDEIAFDTDNLESGTTYELEFEDSGQVKYFNISDLQLEASIDEDGTVFDFDEDNEFTVTGSAVRGRKDGEPVNVAIEVAGNDTDNVTEEYRGDASFERDFDYGDGVRGRSDRLTANDDGTDSTYTVTVVDEETGIEVTAGEFDVRAFPEADSASFGPSPAEDRGDVVEIPIELDDSEEGAQATVAIGSKAETNYVTNVTVEDVDGDGEVTLQYNTFLAGISATADGWAESSENASWNDTAEMTGVRDRIFTAEGDDEISSWRGEHGEFIGDFRDDINASSLDNAYNDAAPDANPNVSAKVATIDAASYQLSVKANEEGDLDDGFNFTSDGATPDDVSTLNLRTRATESSTVWVTAEEFNNDVDIEWVLENAGTNITVSDQATTDEVVVHQVSASGVEGPLKNRTEAPEDFEQADNVTDAFLEEVNSTVSVSGYGSNTIGTEEFNVYNASFEEDNPGPNAERENLTLGNENFELVPDYENDTYYLILELAGTDEDKLEDGQDWNARFGFESYEAVGPVIGGEGDGIVRSLWTFLEADAELETNQEDLVILRNLEGQTIRGSTNVAPGTELNIRVQSRADDGAFLEVIDTRVNSDRTFNETTDVFSDKSAGINFTAQVRRGGDRIGDEFDGEMRGQPTATVTFSDQTVLDNERQEVQVDSVTMSEGGFVAIHEGNATGPVIGVSDKLGAGTTQDVRIDLDESIDSRTTLVAMPHLDSNEDNAYEFPERDGPYTADGTPVTDSGSVGVITPTPTPTPTATPTPTPTPTATPEPTPTPTTEPETDTPEDTPTPTGTAEDGPGFGIVVSILALLAAALIAARRRE
jgi:surface glycoprotein (TIGR04207 family)/PGF-CTERM protein